MSGGLRRRNVPAREADSSDDSGAFSLKRFDVYTKVAEEGMQRSKSGGAVTILTSVIIAVLLFSELVEFCSVEVVDSITVDTQGNRKFPISLDISFFQLRCDEVSIDTVDASGDSQSDVHLGLEKVPVLAKGCRVSGQVVVNKVSGNLHVALGSSERMNEGATMTGLKRMFDPAKSDGFNSSHKIHRISFGDLIPGLASPLDDTQKIVKKGSYMFHYYVKLVPTVFTDRWGDEVYANQYSVTDSARNVQVRRHELSGIPGVFFVYDFSPFLMTKTEKVKPWSYIFTSICALIGGVFSMATMVELVLSSVMLRVFGCMPSTTLPPRLV